MTRRLDDLSPTKCAAWLVVVIALAVVGFAELMGGV